MRTPRTEGAEATADPAATVTTAGSNAPHGACKALALEARASPESTAPLLVMLDLISRWITYQAMARSAS